MIRTIEEGFWKDFFDRSFEDQIFPLHVATEICYNLGPEGDTHDAADQNNGDGTVSQQHTKLPSDSASLWKGNRELCRTLSHYMMYLFVMRSSLLPIAASYDFCRDTLLNIQIIGIGDAKDVRTACQYILERDSNIRPKISSIVELLKSKLKNERWETLKWVWVRMLCHAASKGHRNKHFRQLSQGGEFLTFLWFFLPQSQFVSRDMSLEGRRELGIGSFYHNLDLMSRDMSLEGRGEHSTGESSAPAPHLNRQRTWPPV